MSAIRWLGWTGLALLIGGIAGLAILTAAGALHGASTPLGDALAFAGVAGYGLLTVQLPTLALTTSDSRTRILASVGFLALVVGIAAFLNAALLTTGGPARA